MTLAIADHAATFTVHPLEGSSRFSLLGLLAGLKGLTVPFGWDPTTDEQKRLAQEFRDKHHSPGLYPPGVLEEADRLLVQDDRELANITLGERVVDSMFGTTGPVRVTMSGKPASVASEAERKLEGTK